MAYNHDKDTCDDCGITKTEAKKRPPVATGIDHPQYAFTRSFSLGHDGSVRCANCHREHELKSLFDLMDAREQTAKERRQP
jgi:hypothetical protein